MSDKKEIKRKRMLKYFIEATREIIETDGYEGVTLRKVADLAGYNGATLYSYFDNLEELILYASLRCVKSYNYEATIILSTGSSNREKFIELWKAFSKYSFKNPIPYTHVFAGNHTDKLQSIATKYYSLYPEDLGTEMEELSDVLKSLNLEERNLFFLRKIAEEEGATWPDIDIMNEMILTLYRGLLGKYVEQREKKEEEYYQRMMDYVLFILK